MIDSHDPTNGNPRADMAPGKTARSRRAAPIVLGLAAGAALGLAAVLAFAFLMRDRVPSLTEEGYHAALARWQAHGPASYSLDLDIVGNRPGKVHIEVRDGVVSRMTRDGVVPKQQRTWDYWSVPGIFDTIGEELEMARDPAASFRSPAATGMVMWAEFDPKYGFPLCYDRVVLGADYETHWRVTRFEPLAPTPGGKP